MSSTQGTKPTDHDILDLHAAMFGDFLDWAGTTRRDDRGPGGRVAVSWADVRIQLRNLALDLAAWVGDPATMDTADVANVIADAHHRFQLIHPFKDTDGRTGRVLDHYILWVTFGLHADSLETSPSIEFFPTESHENEYYEGLLEADLDRPERQSLLPRATLGTIRRHLAQAGLPAADLRVAPVHEEGLEPPRLAAPEPKSGWHVSRCREM